MPFILNDPIANTNPASYSLQAQLDSIDFQNLSDPLNRVISGCVVTATSGMGFAVSAGAVVSSGANYSFAGTTGTLATSNTSFARFDLITIAPVSGVATASIVAGTAAPSPDFPSYTGVLIAAILVMPNVTTITSDKIVDKRILAPDPNNQIGILSWMSY